MSICCVPRSNKSYEWPLYVQMFNKIGKFIKIILLWLVLTGVNVKIQETVWRFLENDVDFPKALKDLRNCYSNFSLKSLF